jgi:hypothetical protein
MHVGLALVYVEIVQVLLMLFAIYRVHHHVRVVSQHVLVVDAQKPIHITFVLTELVIANHVQFL